MMSLNSTAKKFDELIVKFRKANVGHEESGFTLTAYTLDEWDSKYVQDFIRCGHDELLGDVVLPDEADPYGYRVYRIVAPKTERYEQAFQAFKPLLIEAGTWLPPSVRDAIPEQFQPTGAGRWWLTFLWWQSLPDAKQFAFIDSVRGCIGLIRWREPFLESADAIERCQLNTDCPVFPPVISPASLKASHDDDPIPSGAPGTKTGQIDLERDLKLLEEMIPTLDDSDENWISNKAAAKLLDVEVKTLANRRSLNTKLESEGKTFGVHDSHCIWRKHGKNYPRYYLPEMQKHVGHLGKFFPKNHLNELP